MKTISFIFSILILSGCSSERRADIWTPEETKQFTSEKVLIEEVTHNLTARSFFEENLKKELESHGLQAVESTAVFDISFTGLKRSVDEIENIITGISEEGFDAINITTENGIEKKTYHSPGHTSGVYDQERFASYLFRFQNIYYNSGYYNEYSISIEETGMFIINEEDVESLVWIGVFKIDNPLEKKQTVHYYVEAKTKQL